MYDADYDAYLKELQEETLATLLAGREFVTKDSGTRAEHPDGVVRDTDAGKPRFDLMFPKRVPFSEQLMTRVAELYERGAKKYGDRNWEKSETAETLEHHEAALMRHVIRFLTGEEDGEDHAAAVVWNVNAVDLTRRNIALKAIREAAEVAEEEAAAEQSGKLRTYTFPYVYDGETCAKEILAATYGEAKGEFEAWNYARVTEGAIPYTPDMEWSQGDILEEARESPGGNTYCWAYKASADVWQYVKEIGSPPSPESSLSSGKLFSLYGPLRCTKGNHVGRVVDGRWH